ncbi:MAG TPA: FAD-dependent oxidoreductase, partial [Thermoanaerobaculia bacterium]
PPTGLSRLALSFDQFVEQNDAALFGRFDAYRHSVQNGTAAPRATPEESLVLIAIARHLGTFLAQRFPMQSGIATLRNAAKRDAEVARFKKEFVTKRVAKFKEGAAFTTEQADALVRSIAPSQADAELALAITANKLLELERDYPRGAKEYSPSADARAALEQLRDHLAASNAFDITFTRRDRVSSTESLPRDAAALHALVDHFVAWIATESKHGRFDGWTSFRLPEPLVFDKLVPTEAVDANRFGGEEHHFRRRDAFHLTDDRMTPREIADEAHYCIYCHERKKDSCSRGFEQPNTNPVVYKPNPLGMPLEGCPLDEKIGEMNALRADGESIASLAMVMIDNPMCPGTGHRICNDCMRSCIFQKQDPVNIPQIETGVLTDVLFLPWGFEIYSLLTMWNPLNARRPIALPYNGKNVLVVGLGPAGYTLAHYLANEGFGVVAIDGLKIEPLPAHLAGVDAHGVRTAFEPIRDVESFYESLDDRIMAGFGGVAEYGITVRWDKNFLKVVRLLLQRREQFSLYGGVRFGGTLEVDDAFALGFDHVVLAAGAGRPTVLDIPNGLAPGVRTASDFLMALQLTGAAQNDSIANMQLRLPVVVIGGGLTAIDTATESLAYYPLQVEKFLKRYETLAAEGAEEEIRAAWTTPERQIADEFLAHARAIRAERAIAADAGREAHVLELLKSWGGVTVAYRRRMVDSPSYTLNHEEIEKAMEEGISFAEELTPSA